MKKLMLKAQAFGGVETLTRAQLKRVVGGDFGCPCKNQCNTDDDCPGKSDCQAPPVTCPNSQPSCTYKSCSGKE